ncbi:hypothetical protein AB0J30_36505 [Streptomyces microflavus]|uniref:hypothetical protein n=1 Tax=Streptomyces microflavus TaxID=1919 RepID=UPI003444578D
MTNRVHDRWQGMNNTRRVVTAVVLAGAAISLCGAAQADDGLLGLLPGKPGIPASVLSDGNTSADKVQVSDTTDDLLGGLGQ